VVKGRLYNADGTPRGDEFLVGNAADQADMAVLADGRVAVCYTRTTDTGFETHVRIYDANGTSNGEGFRISSQVGRLADPAIAAPAITALADGGFVVAYYKQNAGDKGVCIQAFHASGARNGGEYLLEADSENPSITALADGRFAVAYQKNLVQLAAQQIIKGKILTPGVAPSTSSPDLPLPTGAGDVERYAQPRLETLADGGLLLAWAEEEGGEERAPAAST
jgi:hypothetical protein